MTRVQRRLLLRVAAAAILTCLAAPSEPLYGHDFRPDRGQVWLISSRSVSPDDSLDEPNAGVRYWRLSGDGGWLPADARAFHATDDPAVPTTFVVHGNRFGPEEAIEGAWPVHESLCRNAGDTQFRFVIWSWPSERIRGGNRRDVQAKATRSDFESYLLARCLHKMNPQVRMTFVGYSFGARAICGALHLLGGGQLGDWRLDVSTTPRRPAQAVLVAAAMDSYWLSGDSRYAMALGQLDRLLITRNSRDTALRWYPRMYRGRGPRALGFVGPAPMTSSDTAKTEILRLDCEVGRTHSWACYAAAESLQEQFAAYAFATRPTTPVADVAVRSEMAEASTCAAARNCRRGVLACLRLRRR